MIISCPSNSAAVCIQIRVTIKTDFLSALDISFVCDLVRKAGRLALTMRHGVKISTKDSPDDMVTAADYALSNMICADLAARFPVDLIVSEEDACHLFGPPEASDRRIWLIDPIDGTQNYILDDGQYCVMVGLMINRQPAFGWVYAPATDKLYYGGPNFGAFDGADKAFAPAAFLKDQEDIAPVRLLMGSRDRRAHPWVTEMDNVALVKTGSVGLKVGLILENRGDIFAHLSGKLKIWDTAGPAAIALGAGLEVGSLDGAQLDFPMPAVVHAGTIIMGRPGALSWCRSHLYQQFYQSKEIRFGRQ